MTGSNAGRPAVGYIRAGLDASSSNGHSLDAQREKIAAYCSMHGLALLTTHVDDGPDGNGRPGFQRALDAVCQSGAVLVVESLSRLARSTSECMEIAGRLERCGADLASLHETLDTTTMGRSFFRVMASMRELESTPPCGVTAAMASTRPTRTSNRGFRAAERASLQGDETMESYKSPLLFAADWS
jgi:hypothetical protein